MSTRERSLTKAASLSGQKADPEDPMITLCRTVVELEYEALPTAIVEFAMRHILDTLSVTMGGSSQEGVSAVVDFVREQGGKQESYIPFYGGKVPAPLAGMAIGPMARALDLGDVYPGVGHTAEYILPALLGALGRRERVSGNDFITAFIMGNEVLVRVGLGMGKQAPGVAGDQGGHYIFGAVAGVARLLGLTLDQTINAMGMAKAMTQPHDLAMYTPATAMKCVHHGFVAQAAITVCLLAERGITGPRDILAGKLGFYQVLTKGTWETEPERVTQGLSQEWVFASTMFKPYSSCKSTHAGIAAIIDLMEEHNFGPGDIAEIRGDVPQNAWNLNCTPHEPKWNPQTDYDAQFSFPYAVATVAYTRQFFVEEFKEAARARQDVRALMKKITATYDPGLNTTPLSTRLHVTLKDGRLLTRLVSTLKGCPDKPFSLDELTNRAKLLAAYSVTKMTSETVDLLVERVLNLERSEDVVDEIVRLITPACTA